jgi:hypothetical protein
MDHNRLVGELMRDFHDALDLSDSEEENEDGSDPWEDQRPVKQLAKLEKLKEVTLIAFRDYDIDFRWKIPCFQNLRKLVVHGIEHDDNRTDGKSAFAEIAKILLASPNLEFLGLSSSLDEGHTNINLWLLVETYDSERGSSGCGLLKLTELHLGSGYLPIEVPLPGKQKNDYLSKLTDLSALTALHINNWNAPFDYETGVPFLQIDSTLFENAVNLQRISADRLSEDVVELIQHHCSQQSSASLVLSEICVPRFYETQETVGSTLDDDESSLVRGNALFSWPLSSIAPFHGRKLSVGSKAYSADHDLNAKVLTYISNCVDLEELVLGLLQPQVLDHAPWQRFTKEVLSKLLKLRVLIMPADEMDLQRTLVPLDPWQRNWAKRFGLDGKVTEEAATAVVHRKTEVAVEIFRQIKQSMGKLQYLGIGRDIYTCMIAMPYSSAKAAFEVQTSDANGVRNETYQIIQLSTSETMRFKAIQSKAEEDPSSFN